MIIKKLENQRELEELIDLADKLYKKGLFIRSLKDVGINNLKKVEEVCIAKDNGKVVGYVICATPSTTKKIIKNAFDGWETINVKGNWIRGLQIAVAPEYKGTGLAYKLFNHLEKELKRKGYDYLYTTIKFSNIRSKKFSQEKLRFKKIGEISKFGELLEIYEKKIGEKYEK